jgi:hypothetical protein
MSKITKSWRDVLPVHPAADLFPLMTPDELKALGEDIKANGLRVPVVIWYLEETGEAFLLDGRNRLDAMELVGLDTADHIRRDGLNEGYWSKLDPYAFVLSANVHRRHLTAEQKRDVIAKLLKAKPELSDRQVAKTVKASPSTVGTVRQKLEAAGDVSKLDTRADTKGRKQPTKKKRPSRSAGATGSRVLAYLREQGLVLPRYGRAEPFPPFEPGKGCDNDPLNQAEEPGEPYRVTRARGYFASVKEAIRLANENLMVVENRAAWAKLDKDEITDEVIEAAEHVAEAWTKCVERLHWLRADDDDDDGLDIPGFLDRRTPRPAS